MAESEAVRAERLCSSAGSSLGSFPATVRRGGVLGVSWVFGSSSLGCSGSTDELPAVRSAEKGIAAPSPVAGPALRCVPRSWDCTAPVLWRDTSAPRVHCSNPADTQA